MKATGLLFLTTFVNIYILPHAYCQASLPEPEKHLLIKNKISNNYIYNLSYLERLKILGFEPLELRRLHFDLIQNYKIFNNLTPLNQLDYFRYHQPAAFFRKPERFLIKPLNKPNFLLTFFIDL